MAAPATADGSRTETVPDGIVMPKIVLPDFRVVENYIFGWENFIQDEITFMMVRYAVPGVTADYELEMITDEGTIALDRGALVETYSKILVQNCTIRLVHTPNPTSLPEMGVAPKAAALA